MRTINKYIASVLVMVLPALICGAQETSARRVKFERGRTSAVLRGSIVNDSQDLYVLGAKAGQQMTVHLTSATKGAKFDLQYRQDKAALAHMDAEGTVDWEGELPVTGDYVISVYSAGGDTSYTLEVGIR